MAIPRIIVTLEADDGNTAVLDAVLRSVHGVLWTLGMALPDDSIMTRALVIIGHALEGAAHTQPLATQFAAHGGEPLLWLHVPNPHRNQAELAHSSNVAFERCVLDITTLLPLHVCASSFKCREANVVLLREAVNDETGHSLPPSASYETPTVVAAMCTLPPRWTTTVIERSLTYALACCGGRTKLPLPVWAPHPYQEMLSLKAEEELQRHASLVHSPLHISNTPPSDAWATWQKRVRATQTLARAELPSDVAAAGGWPVRGTVSFCGILGNMLCIRVRFAHGIVASSDGSTEHVLRLAAPVPCPCIMRVLLQNRWGQPLCDVNEAVRIFKNPNGPVVQACRRLGLAPPRVTFDHCFPSWGMIPNRETTVEKLGQGVMCATVRCMCKAIQVVVRTVLHDTALREAALADDWPTANASLVMHDLGLPSYIRPGASVRLWEDTAPTCIVAADEIPTLLRQIECTYDDDNDETYYDEGEQHLRLAVINAQITYGDRQATAGPVVVTIINVHNSQRGSEPEHAIECTVAFVPYPPSDTPEVGDSSSTQTWASVLRECDAAAMNAVYSTAPGCSVFMSKTEVRRVPGYAHNGLGSLAAAIDWMTSMWDGVDGFVFLPSQRKEADTMFHLWNGLHPDYLQPFAYATHVKPVGDVSPELVEVLRTRGFYDPKVCCTSKGAAALQTLFVPNTRPIPSPIPKQARSCFKGDGAGNAGVLVLDLPDDIGDAEATLKSRYPRRFAELQAMFGPGFNRHAASLYYSATSTLPKDVSVAVYATIVWAVVATVKAEAMLAVANVMGCPLVIAWRPLVSDWRMGLLQLSTAAHIHHATVVHEKMTDVSGISGLGACSGLDGLDSSQLEAALIRPMAVWVNPFDKAGLSSRFVLAPGCGTRTAADDAGPATGRHRWRDCPRRRWKKEQKGKTAAWWKSRKYGKKRQRSGSNSGGDGEVEEATVGEGMGEIDDDEGVAEMEEVEGNREDAVDDSGGGIDDGETEDPRDAAAGGDCDDDNDAGDTYCDCTAAAAATASINSEWKKGASSKWISDSRTYGGSKRAAATATYYGGPLLVQVLMDDTNPEYGLPTVENYVTRDRERTQHWGDKSVSCSIPAASRSSGTSPVMTNGDNTPPVTPRAGAKEPPPDCVPRRVELQHTILSTDDVEADQKWRRTHDLIQRQLVLGPIALDQTMLHTLLHDTEKDYSVRGMQGASEKTISGLPLVRIAPRPVRPGAPEYGAHFLDTKCFYLSIDVKNAFYTAARNANAGPHTCCPFHTREEAQEYADRLGGTVTNVVAPNGEMVYVWTCSRSVLPSIQVCMAAAISGARAGFKVRAAEFMAKGDAQSAGQLQRMADAYKRLTVAIWGVSKRSLLDLLQRAPAARSGYLRGERMPPYLAGYFHGLAGNIMGDIATQGAPEILKMYKDALGATQKMGGRQAASTGASMSCLLSPHIARVQVLREITDGMLVLVVSKRKKADAVAALREFNPFPKGLFSVDFLTTAYTAKSGQSDRVLTYGVASPRTDSQYNQCKVTMMPRVSVDGCPFFAWVQLVITEGGLVERDAKTFVAIAHALLKAGCVPRAELAEYNQGLDSLVIWVNANPTTNTGTATTEMGGANATEDCDDERAEEEDVDWWNDGDADAVAAGGDPGGSGGGGGGGGGACTGRAKKKRCKIDIREHLRHAIKQTTSHLDDDHVARDREGRPIHRPYFPAVRVPRNAHGVVASNMAVDHGYYVEMFVKRFSFCMPGAAAAAATTAVAKGKTAAAKTTASTPRLDEVFTTDMVVQNMVYDLLTKRHVMEALDLPDPTNASHSLTLHERMCAYVHVMYGPLMEFLLTRTPRCTCLASIAFSSTGARECVAHQYFVQPCIGRLLAQEVERAILPSGDVVDMLRVARLKP